MEIFRSILGFPRRNDFSRKSERRDPRDEDDDPYHGEFFFFSNMPPFGDSGPSQFSDSGRHDDDGFPGGGGMIPGFPGGGGMIPGFPRRRDGDQGVPASGFHMFDIFKHFDDVFKDFERIAIGGGNFDEEGLSFGAPPSGDLRDSMLKQPDADTPVPPRPPPPRFYEDFYQKPQQPPPKGDTDLDEEIRRGNMEIVFGNAGHLSSKELLRPYEYPRAGQDPGYTSDPGTGSDPRTGTDPRPSTSRPASAQDGRAYKSVTVHTYRSADGKVEERRTIQDGRGNEEAVVTRRLDDREYRVTTRRDYEGGETKDESFTNMDKDDKEEFIRMWKVPRGPPSRDIMRNDPGVIDKETKSIFRNLFGQSFPGFPTDLS